MSNTLESVEVSTIGRVEDKLTNNGNEEIIINIDEIPIINDLAKQPADSEKITEQKFNYNHQKKSKEVILTAENETQDKVDQRNVVVEFVDKQGKIPNVWVQNLREVKDDIRPSKQIAIGRRNGSGGRHYQGSGGRGGGGFDYDPSRNSFLLLVFTILLVMLALTFLYNVLVLNSPSMTDFYRTHRRALAFLSAGVLIAMSYVMLCCLQCMRVTPCNYIALFIVTAAMSNLTAVVTCFTRKELILYALIATSVTVAICLLLALSSFDFTAWFLYIIVIGSVITVLSVILLIAKVFFGFYFKPLFLVLLYVSTIVQIILLVMELQMVLGGKSMEISEDDYVLAAYLLYTSIVNLFIQILTILADLD